MKSIEGRKGKKELKKRKEKGGRDGCPEHGRLQAGLEGGVKAWY